MHGNCWLESDDAYLPMDTGLSSSGELWGSDLIVVVRCRRDPARAKGASTLSSQVRGLTILPRLLVSWGSVGLAGSSSSPRERLRSICRGHSMSVMSSQVCLLDLRSPAHAAGVGAWHCHSPNAMVKGQTWRNRRLAVRCYASGT